MMRSAAVAVLLAVTAPAALAQQAAPAASTDSIETVTVTGIKQAPETIARAFISSFSVPSPFVGAISRWSQDICPLVSGLTPQFSDIVTVRIRSIAVQIGAKVKEAPCKPNIIIAFTTQPQAMLDAAKLKDPDILGPDGPHNNVVKYPIQAWYSTATMDIRGMLIPDSNVMGMTSMPGKGFGSIPTAPVGGVPVASRSGSIIRDGLGSVFTTVFIVVDLNKVSKAPLTSIADYVTMLGLAQTDAYQVCEPLPSISNLMAEVCPAAKKAAAITPSDLAFLRGVYKSAVGAPLNVQQANIAREMAPTVPAD